MKLISCWVVFALVIVCNDTNAQISFKTEYIGNSPLLDDNGNRIGDSEGAALVYKGGINIPFSTKVDKKNLPIIWGIGASASYTSPYFLAINALSYIFAFLRRKCNYWIF